MLRVSVLELPARWGRDAPAEALAEVDALLADAPTDLAVVPELAFTGYVSPEGEVDHRPFAEPLDGPTIDAVGRLAKKHRAHVAAPLALAEDDQVYNAMVVVAPDRSIVAAYRKRHPWFPERWIAAGRAPAPLVVIGGLRVTLAICFDGHFLAREARGVLSRADLLVFTSAWVDEDDTRIELLGGLAREVRVSVANANWGPGVVAVPGQGGSCVLDSAGRIVASVPTGGRRADATVLASPR